MKLTQNIFAAALVALLSGCQSDFLEKVPPAAVTDATFWKNESDALMALHGLYRVEGGGNETDHWSLMGLLFKEQMSDNAYGSSPGVEREMIVNGNNHPTNGVVGGTLGYTYRKVAKANYFIENVGKVGLPADENDRLLAEARFIRACYYFYATQYWGAIPLITKVLSIGEANSQLRTPKEEVVRFILEELEAAAELLPVSRPASERGRATRGAALAFRGRLLMAEKRWSEAAAVYQQIMDLDEYELYPDYEGLFLEGGEDNKEAIFVLSKMPDRGATNPVHQQMGPAIIGGYAQMSPLQSLVEDYECIDGLPIAESPLYSEAEPWEQNGQRYRDPRLYYTILLPNYSRFRNILFVTHPDSTDAPGRMLVGNNQTGYGMRKMMDESYTGHLEQYGGDIIVIRYAEVLLSLLESTLEAGEPVTQALLDNTINKVRSRPSVQMPAVTETDPDKLREILRRERRVELAFEGIRYWDILRWKIAHQVLNGDIYGAKICDDPGTCGYQVDEKGHYLIYRRNFRESVDYLWPIPQNALDINPELTQNPGY